MHKTSGRIPQNLKGSLSSRETEHKVQRQKGGKTFQLITFVIINKLILLYHYEF